MFIGLLYTQRFEKLEQSRLVKAMRVQRIGLKLVLTGQTLAKIGVKLRNLVFHIQFHLLLEHAG